jgi:hypothetical protein
LVTITKTNTTWSGTVNLTDDVQVKAGVTLTVAAGAMRLARDARA